ncbi:zinc finger RNA-binding protein 2 isoform X6 [Varanus komodoensis]|uniref:zinc finger RNA-binding protein 2 isoform X6 n=1 Tax=Varanus komodoensis TaxID=61221 RepID=UPI001CF7A5A4|nr:zinc finger RNA-binding protein 2 isoform X6 [Varanus komodoensis]
MAAGNYYGFAAGPQYSAQQASVYSHPPTAASYTVQQAPGLDHAVAPTYTLAVPAARPVTSAAYGGYQLPSTQDYTYGAQQLEPIPQPPVAQNYQQDGYSYGRSPTASGYEAKPYYQAVAMPSQHVAMESYYHSNPQSGYSQSAAAYNQNQPQRQVTPIKTIQVVSAASSNYSTYQSATTSLQNAIAPSFQSYTPSSSYTSSSYNSSPATYSGSNYTSYDATVYTATSTSYYQATAPPAHPPPPQPPLLLSPQQQPKSGGGCPWSSSTTNPITVGGGSSYSKKPPFPSKLLKPKGPPKQPQLHYCEICKISCAGPQTYREHLEGQKHKKKEAALKVGSQTGGSVPHGVQTQLHCKLCDVSCTGADAYMAHIRGAKHQKVLKLHTKLGKPIPSVEPVLVSTANGSASKQVLHAPTSAKPAVGPANSNVELGKAVPAKKPLMAKFALAGASKLLVMSTKQETVKGTPPRAVEEAALNSTEDRLGDLLDVQPVGHDYVEEVLNDQGKMVRFRCRLCECSFNDPNAKDMHLKGRRHRLQYKPARRLSSSDDRHIMSKHSSIYPTEEELQAIQKVVSHSEHALRLISDWLTEQGTGKEDAPEERGKKEDVPRILKGVMRVGILAKGLLLRGDRSVQLILLSAQKPTLALLQSIAEELPKQLGKVTSDEYEIMSNFEEANIVIASCSKPRMQVTVSLTSPLMREGAPTDPGTPSEPELSSSKMLSQEKCLESLAALRHAKWFQARANSLQSCVIIIRVLRDLCQRVPTWGALPNWAMELLVERVLNSSVGPLGPGEALRRVLECIATGMLLADGPGLQDPCEKEPIDALRSMAQQQREDVTASSQHALRMLAFRQIHKVLGMEPLPLLKTQPGSYSRKRHWDMEKEAESKVEGKKDRKEDDQDEAGA